MIRRAIDEALLPLGRPARVRLAGRRPCRRLAVVLFILGSVIAAVPLPLPAQALPVPASTGGETPSAEQIAQWVRELDDQRFVVRHRATEQLIQAGQAAIGPVLDQLGRSNLEVSTRGIHVLQALAASKDVATQEAAIEALQELAASSAKSAARQASAAITTLGDTWQQRALQELENLGAQITLPDQFMAFAQGTGLSVTIGPEWQGSVADLQRFRWLRDVQVIEFLGPQITDDAVRSVELLESAQRVAIKSANISNDAVKSISRLKRVTHVDLMYTPVNDGALEYLQAITSLRELRLYGNNVSQQAVDAFEAAVAQVQVDFKMGAFLGVMCQQAPFPCQVVEVLNDSAALRGGIQVRDIIVRYAGEPIANFDDLRKMIGKNKVGDSVLLQVVRGGAAVACALERRGELELGLETDTTPFGCRVKKLVEAGAGATAGLRVDDVITDVNGMPTGSTDQLHEIYAALEPDAEVTFAVLRNSRLVSVRVTFVGEYSEQRR